MRMRRRGLAAAGGVAALAAALLAGRDARADDPLPLAITLGDSVMRDYPEYPWYNFEPIHGWGQDLPKYFRPDLIQFRNDAWGGESTTSVLANGRWQHVIDSHPRFILISFAISDAQVDPNYAADPNTLYRQNLHRMTVEARAIGAEPIFVTAAPLRYVYYDGIHVWRPNGLEPWVNAMIAQGAQDGVGVADLQYWLLDEYDFLTISVAQQLYGMIIPDGIIPNLPPNTPDIIHFSPYGADQAARHVVSQLPGVSPDLAAFLRSSFIPVLPPWTGPALVLLLGLALAAGIRAPR